MQNSVVLTKEWVRVRRRLYEQAKEQVMQRLGDAHKKLIPYEKEYDSEFRRKWVAAEKKDLIRSMGQADICLLGDFHALQQSQRSHLRLLKDLALQRPLWLGLECFTPEDQPFLDKYLAGKMSEKRFLLEVQWIKRWGFPWEHYKPLLDWAQKNKTPVFGINFHLNKTSAASLRSRDSHIADRVVQLARAYPDRLGLVVIGDLHLAKSHLPNKIQGHRRGRGLKLVRVFQNNEKIYFRLALLRQENKVDLVRLSERDYVVFSVPPWVKWNSYLLFLEKTYDLELDEEELIDSTDHVVRLVNFLKQELKVGISVDKLSIYSAGDPDFYEKIEAGLLRQDFLHAKRMIDMERSFYIPQLQIGYLARLTVNHTASLAAEFIHAELSGRKGLCLNGKEDFLRQIWLQAINYLGTKLINHKRKTDTLEDIKASLEAHDENQERGKEAMLIAVQQKLKEVSYLTTQVRSPLYFSPRHRSSYWEAARLLGGMMGERLYNSMYRGQVAPHFILKLMRTELESEIFDKFYYEVIEFIESLPVFKSKRERL